jgi:hypothetical protein
LSFLLLLPFANLHLLTYDRWHLQRGALPRPGQQEYPSRFPRDQLHLC